VTDTGPGIPKELQPLLFLAYKQLPTASSSGSTGLGLAITAKMTELLNGNITVDSEPGKGTTFCVTIPYEKGKTQPVAVPDKPVPPDLTGEHFLLVDDDESSLLLLRLLLQRWKATITLARSVAEAGTHIEEGEFSFVVMDWNLGDGRGDLLLQKFSPQRKNPPIIISSGDDALKTVVASFTHLQIHFVPKPIDPDDLAAGIDAQKNARK
jgi:CheY-like chemotaxis protein